MKNQTIWERLGAAEGLWAIILLTIQWWLLRAADLELATTGADAAAGIIAGRGGLEWITLLRIVAGIMLIWFMSSLTARVRRVEGEPGRLATITLTIGTVYGAMWLLSALFNSASILFATTYNDEDGARLAAVLAREVHEVLGPALLIGLTLAVTFGSSRFGGFPRLYLVATMGACGALFLLAVLDWAGSGTLSDLIFFIGLLWIGATSALLAWPRRVPEAE